MRQRASTGLAECSRKARCTREIEARDELLPRNPGKSIRRHEEVCRVRRTCGLPAPRAIAVHESNVRRLDLVGHRAAQAATHQYICAHRTTSLYLPPNAVLIGAGHEILGNGASYSARLVENIVMFPPQNKSRIVPNCPLRSFC